VIQFNQLSIVLDEKGEVLGPGKDGRPWLA
jgi:hypothetical protein